MGVERAVTRWYVQRQLLLHEVALLQAKAAPSVSTDGAATRVSDAALQEKLALAQEKLRMLGDCPRPMMG